MKLEKWFTANKKLFGLSLGFIKTINVLSEVEFVTFYNNYEEFLSWLIRSMMSFLCLYF